jgi:hypothetical protein
VPHEPLGVPSELFGVPSELFGVPSELFGVPSELFGVPSEPHGVEVWHDSGDQEACLAGPESMSSVFREVSAA